MTRKHGSRETFEELTYGTPFVELAKQLRVDVKTVRQWRSGARPVPWWVVNVLLLEAYVREDTFRQMHGRLAVLGFPVGPRNRLRAHLDQALSEALFDALQLGLVRDVAVLSPRQPSIASATA